MKFRIPLLLFSIFVIGVFTYLSYTVAKEGWQKTDFDSTVKLQDHIPRRFDKYFSYFSLLGSIEVTIGFCTLMIILSLVRFKWLHLVGWLMIIPASLAEVFGKLVLFHPAPPNFMHRSIFTIHLPFYVHTDYSYPSGHMTRTLFIVTIFICLAYQSKNLFNKFALVCPLLSLAFLMGLTRVYLGEHWLSDVLGGSILGIGMGLLASVLILDKQKV